MVFESFAHQLPNVKFSEILVNMLVNIAQRLYSELVKTEGVYFYSNMEPQIVAFVNNAVGNR